MHLEPNIDLADTLEQLARGFELQRPEDFEFNHIAWIDRMVVASGRGGANPYVVTLQFVGAPLKLFAKCSICGSKKWCPHARALILVLSESGIAADIERNHYAPGRYSFKQKKTKPPAKVWKSQLGNLARQLEYYAPAQSLSAKFPAGRESIFVIQQERYSSASAALEIAVATRPVQETRNAAPGDISKPKKSSGTIYRHFTGGIRALAASSDPIDREIAEKMSLTSSEYSYYESRQRVTFRIAPDGSLDLIARLARSGRLFWNSEYQLHNQIVPLGWLCDERFDLKFEIAGREPKYVSLGVCAVTPQTTVSLKQMKEISSWHFVDLQDRLGFFCRPVARELFNTFKSSKPIVVPRQQAADLIETVMGMPSGLGVEFVGCDDIRPQRVTVVPKPRIHIKAPSPISETLEASIHFDYDGVQIPLARRSTEFYDKSRGVLVEVDSAFHDRSVELVASVGAKLRQGYQGPLLLLPKKKLPRIVAHLVHHGWHVEADGKLYRTGSSFDINIVSGIDWFELQGKAHFDQASVDLPRLLATLRAGERSVVLDDGSIGVIPEEWIKRFGGVAELASSDDGAVKFGPSQVGLLDALLAEQGEINVDEKFSAARQALRAFDRIEPQEPPRGFVGALRPYQKLAQGWFGFLRQLGFGGCLADDMGLGKTIQVLSLLEQRRELASGPSLIVVPRSLIFNWIAEARKFAPAMRVLDQSHAQRRKETDHLADFDLVLTTYGTLRRDAAFLKDFEFDYVVLDEAQAIKNAGTEAAKAARLLKGRHKLALSGTPIENHLGELWSLFDFLNPGMLGRVGRFAALADGAGADQRKLLAAAVRPFILRRTKRQVAPELPERVEQTIVVELEGDQRRAYDELREYYRRTLLNKIDSDGIGKSQIVILEALLRLRQAACHPGLIDKARISEPSAKIDELLIRLTSAMESGERVLVFSQFTSLLSIVKLRLKQAGIDFLYLDGQTKNRQALVEQFQSGTGAAVFLISLKAGGVGLNLTAARTVYLLDPWWNPAVEAQAIDRTHRIGQQQTVFATRLIAADTVEQKVLELQAKKKGLADAIIDADNAGISSLTREDLELLLA